VGVYQDVTVIGIVGFAVLFAGVMVAVATPGRAPTKTAAHAPSTRSATGSSSVMNRLNERWERRQRGETP